MKKSIYSDPLLQILQHQARLSTEAMSDLLSMSQEEVVAKMKQWEEDGVILGYHAVINLDGADDGFVSAFIEVKVTPERGGGFDRLAMRIARFDQVKACYLASGGYDLMVIVEGKDLRDVARFVSEKLSSIDGVISTATHFRLKTYKESGFIYEMEHQSERLSVAP